MKNCKFLGFLASLLGCLFVGKSAADEIKEVAVFGVFTDANKFRPVNSLQFTADSSRLLVNGGLAQDPSDPTKINQWASWVIWDVAKKQQISFCPGAGLPRAWVTGDGGEVICPGAHIYVWDGATGKALPSLWDELKVACTAGALSPDSAYLAVAFNEYNSGNIKRPPIGQPRVGGAKSRFGSIAVWDLKARKMKWRMPGVEAEFQSNPSATTDFHNSEVSNLAFSPDGTKLAAVVGNKLNVYALETGKDAPTLKISSDQKGLSQMVKDGRYLSYSGEGTQFQFLWVADGRSLLLRNRTEFEFLDAATGERKEKFDLNSRSEAPEPSPAKLPPPKSVPKAVGGSATPEEPVSFASSLSADAKSLAIASVGKESHELAIAIWDVAAHRRQAILKLPGEKFVEKKGVYNWPPIALSPNGKQLAVADGWGGVHVYDVPQIAPARPAARSEPAGNDSPPVGSARKRKKRGD